MHFCICVFFVQHLLKSCTPTVRDLNVSMAAFEKDEFLFFTIYRSRIIPVVCKN